MSHPMMWVFAVLIVLAMGGVALVAAGRGEPMTTAYDDRPDALVPADNPIAGADLRRVRFSLALRGYRMSEVDALLDRLVDEQDETPPASLATPTSAPTATQTATQTAMPLPRLLAERWAAGHPVGTDILDFSPESVDQVESLLDQWSRQPERELSADEADVWAAGAYLGEILVRAIAGATWSTSTSDTAAAPGAPVILLPSGRIADPIGKAMERFDGDERDSVTAFVEAALQSS